MSTPQITIGKNGKVTVNGTSYNNVTEALTALAAKASGTGPISAKVAPKGGLSVYGLQRRPVTLYKQQWQRLLAEFNPEWLEMPGLSQGKDDPRFAGPQTAEPEPETDDGEPTDEELALLARMRRARGGK